MNKRIKRMDKYMRKLDNFRSKLQSLHDEFDDIQGFLASEFYDLYIEELTSKTMTELHFDGDDLFDAAYNHGLKECRKRAKDKGLL